MIGKKRNQTTSTEHFVDDNIHVPPTKKRKTRPKTSPSHIVHDFNSVLLHSTKMNKKLLFCKRTTGKNDTISFNLFISGNAIQKEGLENVVVKVMGRNEELEIDIKKVYNKNGKTLLWYIDMDESFGKQFGKSCYKDLQFVFKFHDKIAYSEKFMIYKTPRTSYGISPKQYRYMIDYINTCGASIDGLTPCVFFELGKFSNECKSDKIKLKCNDILRNSGHALGNVKRIENCNEMEKLRYYKQHGFDIIKALQNKEEKNIPSNEIVKIGEYTQPIDSDVGVDFNFNPNCHSHSEIFQNVYYNDEEEKNVNGIIKPNQPVDIDYLESLTDGSNTSNQIQQKEDDLFSLVDPIKNQDDCAMEIEQNDYMENSIYGMDFESDFFKDDFDKPNQDDKDQLFPLNEMKEQNVELPEISDPFSFEDLNVNDDFFQNYY